MKNDTRTTLLTALGTFLGLCIISVIAWAMTRPPAPEPVPVANVASVAAPVVESHEHAEDFERISLDEFKAAYDRKEVVALDVRSIEQYGASHIPDAMQIPLTRVEGEIPYLPKDKLIVTYCTCPNEESSGQAAMILAHGGIKAKALRGGLAAWAEAGYPTAQGVQ